MIRPLPLDLQHAVFQIALSLIATILYCIAGAMVAYRLLGRYRHGEPTALPRYLPLMLAGAAAAIHGALIYADLFTPEGLNLGFFNALSLAAWLIAALMVLLALRFPIDNLGAVLMPTAALALVLHQWMPPNARPIAVSHPIQIHIVLSILAYGILTLAAVQAGLLSIQESRLRRRRLGSLIRVLPPMARMETLLFQLIGIGLTLLTLSLLSGLLFLDDLFAQHLAHKTVLSCAAWLVFAGLLWGRRQQGWRGRRAIRWTLWGFAFLAAAYFGSKFVLELVLLRQ